MASLVIETLLLNKRTVSTLITIFFSHFEWIKARLTSLKSLNKKTLVLFILVY